MSLVTVIIVSWNCKEALFRCLDSISREKMPEIKIIVVDNASEDGTQTEGPQKYPHVIFLNQIHNLGFAKANNLAAASTDSKYLFVLNPDTIVQEGCLKTLIKFMSERSDCGLASPLLLNDNKEIIESTFRFPSLWNYWTEHSMLLVLFEKIRFSKKQLLIQNQMMLPAKEIEWATGAAFVVRREALGNERLFDEQFFMYSEDADLCKRLANKKWKRYLVPAACVIHSHRASSSKARARTIFHLFNSMFLYFKKHMGFISQFLLRLSISADMFIRIMMIVILHKKDDAENRERLRGYKAVLRTLNPFFPKAPEKEI